MHNAIASYFGKLLRGTVDSLGMKTNIVFTESSTSELLHIYVAIVYLNLFTTVI